MTESTDLFNKPPLEHEGGKKATKKAATKKVSTKKAAKEKAASKPTTATVQDSADVLDNGQLTTVENKAPATSEAGSVMGMVERLAMLPDANPDVLEKLLNMQERVLDRTALESYNRDFVRCQENMPDIIRNRHNTQTDSWYADLGMVSKALMPHVSSYGFGVSFGTTDSPHEKHVRVTMDLIHRDGHVHHLFYDSPYDDSGIAGKINKTPTHARASANTYGQRYLICMAFNVVVLDDDDGNAAGEELPRISEKDAADIQDMLEQCPDGTLGKMLTTLKVQSIDDIPEQSLAYVMDILAQKVKRLRESDKK